METKTNQTGLKEAIEQIENTAQLAVKHTQVDLEVDDGKGGKAKVPVLLVPRAGSSGVQVVSLLEHVEKGTKWASDNRLLHAEGPDKRVGTANHETLASFIAHVIRFKDDDSAVWATQGDLRKGTGPALIAVLDYHRTGVDSAARWGKHRAVYPCPLSEAWIAWGGGKAVELDQEQFAAFLDKNDRDLADGTIPGGKNGPSPADLITLANNLETYSSSTAKREKDANGRTKISFSKEEGVNGTSIAIPPSFNILIPIFTDGQREHMEVRLRTRVEGGEAVFTINIHNASEKLTKSFEGVCDKVKIETALPVYQGAPEA